ncbi:hypothetical protein Pelo_15677 [Pelomyxa schiedti]|nr:hypothetical protein Pelo_15677 [Pelomyxa schiedti]
MASTTTSVFQREFRCHEVERRLGHPEKCHVAAPRRRRLGVRAIIVGPGGCAVEPTAGHDPVTTQDSRQYKMRTCWQNTDFDGEDGENIYFVQSEAVASIIDDGGRESGDSDLDDCEFYLEHRYEAETEAAAAEEEEEEEEEEGDYGRDNIHNAYHHHDDPVWLQVKRVRKLRRTRESMRRDLALHKSKLADMMAHPDKEPATVTASGEKFLKLTGQLVLLKVLLGCATRRPHMPQTETAAAAAAATDADAKATYRNGNGKREVKTELEAANTARWEESRKNFSAVISGLQRRIDDISECLPKLQAQVEPKVLSILDAPHADAEEPTEDDDIYGMVKNFWKFMRAIGHSAEEIFAVWHQKPEIVGVGVTASMSREDRHHYDLVVGTCVAHIAEMFISEFGVLNDLVPVGVGPFFGRLFEIASREYCKSAGDLDWPVFGAAIKALKRLMWVPNCRHFFVPFANQLRVLLNRIPHHYGKELLLCCVNLGPLLPELANELCDTFVSSLAEGRSVGSKLPFRWVNGWDVLPLQASNDVIEFLKHYNITARIIAGFLQFCESFGLQEAFFKKVPWITRKVISRVTKLCSVDPANGHKAIVQFVENHIGSDKMLLKAVSALLIIPVVITGGSVNENLAMNAITLATADDSPPHLDILLSVKQLFGQVSSSSLELLLEKAIKTHTRRGEGLLYHMMKFCADQIKSLPLFSFAATQYIAQYKREHRTPLKTVRRILEDKNRYLFVLEIWSSRLHSVYRHCSRFGVKVTSLSVDITAWFATSFTVLLASEHPGENTRTLSSGAFTCLSSVMKLCCQSSQSMIEDNEGSVVSLWSRSPDRRACMEDVLKNCTSTPGMWGPLLKALLISEIQPIAPLEPRKLPRLLRGTQQANVVVEEKIQEVLTCPVVTKCYEAVLSWLQPIHPITGEFVEKKICKLMAMWPGRFKTTFLFWAVSRGAYHTVCKLLPLCEPGRVPSTLLLSAIEHGFRDIADLLWCHGVRIPEYKLRRDGNVDIKGELVDAHSRSLWRFVNHAATWDPFKHELFPWWFKCHILRTVLLCWLRCTSLSLAATTPTDPEHLKRVALDGDCNSPIAIGRLSHSTVHHILSFLSPVHWF